MNNLQLRLNKKGFVESAARSSAAKVLILLGPFVCFLLACNQAGATPAPDRATDTYVVAGAGSARYARDASRSTWQFSRIGDQDNAYEATIGWRLWPRCAFEISYADLGHHDDSSNDSIRINADLVALTGSFVGLVPWATRPDLELIFRAGAARTEADVFYLSGVAFPASGGGFGHLETVHHDKETGLAGVLGMGIQERYDRIGWRIEYKYITTEEGASVASASFIWHLR